MKATKVTAHTKPRASKGRARKGSVRQEKLFCAALCVALEQGFGHVTLASVAKKAEISKGGLLHHFSTKSDLITAMLKHYSQRAPSTETAIDPLAATALIAASESPHLLSGIMDYLDIGAINTDSTYALDGAQLNVERMRSLIGMLHLKLNDHTSSP